MTAFRNNWVVKKEDNEGATETSPVTSISATSLLAIIPVYEPVYVNGELVYAGDPLDGLVAKGEGYVT